MTPGLPGASGDAPLTLDERTELERLTARARELERAIDGLRPKIWSVARRAEAAREELWLLEEKVRDEAAGGSTKPAGERASREESLRWVLHAMTVVLLCCAVAVKSVSSPALSDTLFVVLAIVSVPWFVGWAVVSEEEAARESARAWALVAELGLQSTGSGLVSWHAPGKSLSGCVDGVFLDVEEFVAGTVAPDYFPDWRTRFRARVRTQRDLYHRAFGLDAVEAEFDGCLSIANLRPWTDSVVALAKRRRAESDQAD